MSAPFIILHADDDRIARMVLNHVCGEEEGCEVIQTTTGLEAWRLLDAGVRPDLCIFDFLMPELDGLSLLRQMRADRRFSKMPVIICTGVRERATIDAAAELGIEYYMIKPYTVAHLQEQIRRARLAHAKPADDETALAFSTRMGVDLATGQEMLDGFAQEIHAFVAEAGKSIALLDFHAVAKLISGLKATANCLGITSVFVELSQMERIVTSLDKSPMGLPPDVSAAVRREWQVDASRRGCDPALARLQTVASRWGSQGASGAEMATSAPVGSLESPRATAAG